MTESFSTADLPPSSDRFVITNVNRVRRHHERAQYDRAAVYAILDRGLVAHVAFVDNGRPIVIPRVSREPALADLWAKGATTPSGTRTTRVAGPRGIDDDRTYICVPVQQSLKCRGVLEVELAFKNDRNYDRTMKFYGVVASMLAGALKMGRLLEADRQRLVDENVRLRDELR